MHRHPHPLRAAIVLASILAIAASATAWMHLRSTPWAALMRLWGRFSYHAIAPATGDVLLPVPFYRQEHALSCEAAALRMALAYRGIHVTERDIIDRIGTDPTPRVQRDGRLVWGDPDKGFVGDINGRMFSSGYGVHWGPVARAANQWRLAEVIWGWDAALLATQLRLGNPVIAWGYIGSGKPFSWETPDGKTVHTVSTEHTFVVNGFRGDAGAPEGFYFMDPIYGQRYLASDAFFNQWDVFGRAGILMY